jgi:hypothetical protein
MNNKKLITWQIIGVFVIFGIATAWHFIYVQIPNAVTATIFPVNESPWEHIKMFFFPAIIYYVVQYFFIGKKYKNFIAAHGASIVLMPIIMFAMFYGYRLGLKIEESLNLDIVITFISIALGSLIAYKMTVSEKPHYKMTKLVPIVVVVLYLAYSLLTFFTPHVPLFHHEELDLYGIEKDITELGHSHGDESEEEHEAHEQEDVHDEENEDEDHGEEDGHDEDAESNHEDGDSD